MPETQVEVVERLGLSRQIAEKPEDSFRIRFLPLPSKEE